MRFECAHCQCHLSVEIDWNDRTEVPVQCGKCEGISVVKSKSRMAKLNSSSQVSETATTAAAVPPPAPAKFSPPPFRATDVKVPSFLKNKVDESIRAFDSETEQEASVQPTIDAGFDTKKKWLAFVGAIAILSGSYLIWNTARIAKRTYRFSQTATAPASASAEPEAKIAN